ncbi:hypothetical protein F4804DRAFT_9849 [Jackrogersella minutella]|nr:hypothetical protein F4804DRAFT_9849 [Jackrogersella minutella]
MASPLSVGDCIAIIGVIIKGFNAFKGSSETVKEFESLKGDLLAMKLTLERLSHSYSNSNSPANLHEIDSIISRCRDVLTELTLLTEKYAPTKSRTKTGYRRLTWTFWGKKEAEPFRLRIHGLSTLLTVAQVEVNRQAIERMKEDAQRQTDALSLQLEQSRQDVKLCLSATIQEPWDHKPLEFQDAIGRKFPIPLEACQTFEDFCDILHFSFKRVSHDLPFIINRDFWLFTPATDGSPWWYLVHENDWKHIARSGTRLGMSFFELDPAPGGFRLRCNAIEFLNPVSESRMSEGHWTLAVHEHSLIQFSTPLPPWTKLPEDLEFRWWSTPPLFGPVSMTLPAEKGRVRNTVMNHYDSSSGTPDEPDAVANE